MTIFSKFRNPERVILILVLLGYAVFQYPFLHLDLWNDEIYTLKYFTFVSPLQTVTDYHSTNNHVLFNLINNFYLKLIGEKSVYTLMDHPWVLRLIPLFYSTGTIFFTFKCAEKISGRTTALLSVIFLCTCVPFCNFAVQIRGYSLSAFLLTAISYFIFSFIERPKRSILFFIAGLTATVIYAIPLNIYPIISIGVFLFLMIAISFILKTAPEEKQQQAFNIKKYFFLMIAVMTGVLSALLFYFPIFQQVFFNEVISSDPKFSSAKWWDMTKQIFIFFFSFRYWILILAIGGLSYHFYKLTVQKNKTGIAFIFYLLIMLIIPFAISWARKDALIDRTFINLIPFFALFLAWTVNGIFVFTSNKKLVVLFEAGIAVYCLIILSLQMKNVSNYLREGILTSTRTHNIYYNYYLHHYRPMSVVRNFKETFYSNSDFVTIRDAEPHDLPEYLNKFNIPVYDFSSVDSVLEAGRRVFLFSRYPNEINSASFREHHHCNVKLISEDVSYHNVFELTYTSPAK